MNASVEHIRSKVATAINVKVHGVLVEVCKQVAQISVFRVKVEQVPDELLSDLGSHRAVVVTKAVELVLNVSQRRFGCGLPFEYVTALRLHLLRVAKDVLRRRGSTLLFARLGSPYMLWSF
jgi:hypothetical protein